MNLGTSIHLNELAEPYSMADLIHNFLKDPYYNGPYANYLDAIASSTHICLNSIAVGICEVEINNQ